MKVFMWYCGERLPRISEPTSVKRIFCAAFDFRRQFDDVADAPVGQANENRRIRIETEIW